LLSIGRFSVAAKEEFVRTRRFGTYPTPTISLTISQSKATKSLRLPYFFAIVDLMTDRSYLGEFELMLLLAVVHLGEQAYGVPISRELEENRGRSVSVGSVYAALERLEAKGLILSELGDPTPERGGKAKRYFRITKEGLRQIHETRRVLTRMWQVLPELKMEVR
jgi:DNA-binding PadR family transcriptional regulator